MASYDFSMHGATTQEPAMKTTPMRGEGYDHQRHPAELFLAGYEEEPEWEYLSDDGEDAYVVEELLKLELLLESSLKTLADTKGTATNGFDTLETDSLDLVRAPRAQKPQEEEAQDSSNKVQWTIDELEEEWTMPLAGEDDEDAQEEARQPPRRRTAWTSMVQRPPRRSSTRVCRQKNGVPTAPITSE